MAISEKKYLDQTGLTYFWTKIREYIDDDLTNLANLSDYITFLKSVTTGTTVNNINVGTRLHIINLSSNESLSLVGGSSVSGGSVAPAGYDIHIIVKNTATNPITVTMPTGDAYDILLCESTYTIPAGKYIEISVITDGDHAYYRVAEQN